VCSLRIGKLIVKVLKMVTPTMFNTKKIRVFMVIIKNIHFLNYVLNRIAFVSIEAVAHEFRGEFFQHPSVIKSRLKISARFNSNYVKKHHFLSVSAYHTQFMVVGHGQDCLQTTTVDKDLKPP
jgi:hypothetical protein